MHTYIKTIPLMLAGVVTTTNAVTTLCDASSRTLFNPPESQRTYSSFFQYDGPYANDPTLDGLKMDQSMIDGWPGWGPAANQFFGQWLILDLGEDREITGMAVQGRAPPYYQWITNFSVDYWMDGETEADAKNVDSGKPGSVFDLDDPEYTRPAFLPPYGPELWYGNGTATSSQHPDHSLPSFPHESFGTYPGLYTNVDFPSPVVGRYIKWKMTDLSPPDYAFDRYMTTRIGALGWCIPTATEPVTTTEPITTTEPLTTTEAYAGSSETCTDTIEMCIVLEIFEAFGIQQVTFVESLYRRKRSAQDALTAVMNYGCWCSKPFTGDALKGKPLDEIDQICKSWSQCSHCTGLSGCSGSLNDAFNYTISPITSSYTCNAATECGLNRCECAGELGLSLAQALILNNFQLDSGNNNAVEGACVRGMGNSFTDACCGVSPTWKPFNTQINQCLSGDVVPI